MFIFFSPPSSWWREYTFSVSFANKPEEDVVWGRMTGSGSQRTVYPRSASSRILCWQRIFFFIPLQNKSPCGKDTLHLGISIYFFFSHQCSTTVYHNMATTSEKVNGKFCCILLLYYLTQNYFNFFKFTQILICWKLLGRLYLKKYTVNKIQINVIRITQCLQNLNGSLVLTEYCPLLSLQCRTRYKGFLLAGRENLSTCLS